MPCYHPLKAMRSSSGVKVLDNSASIWNLLLPCGQCVGCRLERSRQWAMRCMHEASLYEDNCFITLTYSPENVPVDGGLNYRHFQLFMKRLRKRFPEKVIRFYMCGEYGENYGRPHFHACLFNHNFIDRLYWRSTPSGSKIFRSQLLEELWPFGFSSIGDVTFESAAYVARYVMKKVTGSAADQHYKSVNVESGEIFDRRPEFNKMSLKPGIGAGWYEKYSTDVFPHDHVIVNGQETKPPRYYDRLLKRVNPDLFETILQKRIDNAQKNAHDNTRDRLAVKEQVTSARIRQLKRVIS